MGWKCKLEPVIKQDQCQEWEGVLMLWSREKVPHAEVRREAQKTKHLYNQNRKDKAKA